MVRVKICGITNLEDALLAARLGADAVGFIFYEASPRGIDITAAANITKSLPPYLTRVGVFVNAKSSVIEKAFRECKLDVAQLHGDETPEIVSGLGRNVIKSLRLKKEDDIEIIPEYEDCAILLDTFDKEKFGGTGRSFNWDWAKEARRFKRPIILSGGLDSSNVGAAIDAAMPDAVDVSSGVESRPGKKDPRKLARFINAVRLR